MNLIKRIVGKQTQLALYTLYIFDYAYTSRSQCTAATCNTVIFVAMPGHL